MVKVLSEKGTKPFKKHMTCRFFTASVLSLINHILPNFCNLLLINTKNAFFLCVEYIKCINKIVFTLKFYNVTQR
jgi:hypothetical protein